MIEKLDLDDLIENSKKKREAERIAMGQTEEPEEELRIQE
jgi:hypothetical protein